MTSKTLDQKGLCGIECRVLNPVVERRHAPDLYQLHDPPPFNVTGIARYRSSTTGAARQVTRHTSRQFDEIVYSVADGLELSGSPDAAK